MYSKCLRLWKHYKVVQYLVACNQTLVFMLTVLSCYQLRVEFDLRCMKSHRSPPRNIWCCRKSEGYLSIVLAYFLPTLDCDIVSVRQVSRPLSNCRVKLESGHVTFVIHTCRWPNEIFCQRCDLYTKIFRRDYGLDLCHYWLTVSSVSAA